MAENHYIDWAPHGVVTFYHKVPLDPTYNHSFAFTNRDGTNREVRDRLNALEPFKISTASLVFNGGYPTNQISYTRVTNQKIRVGVPASVIYDANYLVFHNQDFPESGNPAATQPRWYFCFVNSIEFINPNCTEVTFEVDVIMTWCEAGIFEDCFIAREHSITDAIDGHLQPEDIEIGEYRYEEISDFFDTYFEDLKIVIGATVTETGNDLGTAGITYNNLFGGCAYYTFDTAKQASVFLNMITEYAKSDAVVSVFYMPTKLCVTGPVIFPQRYFVDTTLRRRPFEGYAPNNNKLFTYPYRFLYMTDGAGHSAEYRFERFRAGQAVFDLWCPIVTNTQAMVVPRNYATNQDRVTVRDLECLDFAFKSGQYPQLTYNIDTWKRWLASNAVPTAINVLGGITSSIFSTNVVGGLVGTVAQTVSQMYTHAIQPNEIRGATGGELSLTAVRKFGIHLYLKEITGGYARVVDNFYDMFGYKSNTHHTPSVNTRPHWTYVQTKGCNLTASMPADAAAKVVQIFDNGCTFWNDLTEVGKYSELAQSNRGTQFDG